MISRLQNLFSPDKTTVVGTADDDNDPMEPSSTASW